ncbi:MAG: glycosyltransferase family 2 protein, partial [Acidobacteria bacterium]
MKLSIVTVCWNDRETIRECLGSIYAGTRSTEFEVIVSDNGSTDGSAEFIR